MKKITPLLFCFFFAINSNAQIFSESVEIFDVTFKAKKITGQKRFSGKEDAYRSKILNPLIEKKSSDFISNLGSYRDNVGTAQIRGLFNYSILDKHLPHLDNIDFDFYESKGFNELIIANPNLSTDTNFIELRKRIKEATTSKEKKAILFEAKYQNLRNKLILTRCDIIPNEFSIDKKKVSKITAELKAEVDTILVSNQLSGNAKVRAYLENLADETTTVKGIYYSVTFDNDYVDIINNYLENNIDSIKRTNSLFSNNLKKYLKNNTSVVNSSFVAIQIAGNIDLTKVNVTQISGDLQSQFQIPSTKASNISASLKVTFEKQVNITFKNKFDSVFLIRYFSSDEFNEMKKL